MTTHIGTPKITPTRLPRLGRDGTLQALLRRGLAWLAACFAPGAPRPSMRAGLLDTGELVLVDAEGRAQTFSAGTTELIRRTVGKGTGAQSLTWPPLTGADAAQLMGDLAVAEALREAKP